MRYLLVCLFVLLVSTAGLASAQEFAGTLLDQDKAVFDVATSATGERWVVARLSDDNRYMVDVHVSGRTEPVSVDVPAGTMQVAFMADGLSFITHAFGGQDNLIVWRWNADKQVYEKSSTARVGDKRLGVSPASEEVFLGGVENVFLWNGDTAKPRQLAGRPMMGWSTRPSYSPDGRYIAWGYLMGHMLCIHDRTTHQTQWHPQPDNVSCVAFSPDGKRLAWAVTQGGSSLLFVQDLTNLKMRPTRVKVPGWSVQHMVFHDDTLIYAGSWHDDNFGKNQRTSIPHVQLWQVASNQKGGLIEPTSEDYVAVAPIPAYRPHGDKIVAIAISRGHGLLLTASSDGLVHMWRLPRPDRQAARQ